MDSFRMSAKTSFTLDLIRWISAQMVLFGHAFSYFPILNFQKTHSFFLIQNVGVVIFFLLSGFLISYSTFAKMASPDYRFRSFFIDRFSRIYTGFLPCIIMVLVIDLMSIYVFKND